MASILKNGPSRRSTIELFVWVMAIWTVLQVHRYPVSEGHDICGVWGCGPPINALISYHAFWMLLFVPPTVFVCRRLSPVQVRQVGMLAMILGLLGFVGVAGWEAYWWLPHTTAFQRGFIWQRYLFSVVTLLDVPIVQITLSGLTCLAAARFRRVRERAADPIENPEEHLESSATEL